MRRLAGAQGAGLCIGAPTDIARDWGRPDGGQDLARCPWDRWWFFNSILICRHQGLNLSSSSAVQSQQAAITSPSL